MTKINNIIELLKDIPPEFTSEEASFVLATIYKAPDKILEALVRSGQLIRLKRGLFTVANEFHRFAAANAIHGPSYISFETALSFYDLIPERVTTIMSVVDNRQLKMKAGGFEYIFRSQERSLFALGMTAKSIDGRNVLMATPEKALLDTIAWNKLNTARVSQVELFDAMCGSYRFIFEDLVKLSQKHLIELASKYRNSAPQMFTMELQKRKRSRSHKIAS
jgi:predicted transcriptional regulator of viral defense system